MHLFTYVPSSSWQALLDSAISDEEIKALRMHEHTGRPLGEETFVKRLERKLGKILVPQKAGRPKKQIN